MRVKRDAEYDELGERPKRKYQRDASGLRVPVVVVPNQTEMDGPEEPSGESVFRLAWLFVEGWRQRLQKAGDMVERSRWEFELDGTPAVPMHSRASSLTFGQMLADARPHASGEQSSNNNSYYSNKKKKKMKKQRKSVHWA